MVGEQVAKVERREGTRILFEVCENGTIRYSSGEVT